MTAPSDDDDRPFDRSRDGINQTVEDTAKGATEHLDVQEYDDHIKVVADIPGVKETDIDLECNGRMLAIRVSARSPPILMKVDLPGYVDDGSANATVNNGILEITLDRDTDPANIGYY